MESLILQSRFQNYAGGVIVLALIVGGGTSSHLWSDQLIKLAMLPYAIVGFSNLHSNRLGISARVFVYLILAVLAFEFLPIGINSNFPNFSNITPGWQFVTTTPYNTLDAIGTTLCLLGFGLNVATRPDIEQIRLIRFIVLGLLINVLIALIQLSFSSELRIEGVLPYAIWVGVFANENHFTTLLFMMIPLLAWQLIDQSGRPKVYVFVSILILALLYAIGSRAGTIISTALVIFCFVWFFWIKRIRKINPLLILASIIVVFIIAYWLNFQQAWIDDARSRYFYTTWKAVKENWLTGTGLGSFVTVYSMYESSRDIFVTYVNHAHNDYIELLLEIGIWFVPLFIFYIIQIFWNFYRSGLTQAAVISIFAILLHSLVEYPMRTMAVSVIFYVLSAIVLSSRNPKLGDRSRNGTTV